MDSTFNRLEQAEERISDLKIGLLKLSNQRNKKKRKEKTVKKA